MTRDRLPQRNAFWTLSLSLLLALLLLQTTTIPQRINFWLYDALITTVPLAADPNVAIVAIDEHSLDQLGRWPWPRRRHAELVRQLTAAGADAVVFDVLFPEPSADDLALADALRNHGRVVLPVHLSPPAEDDPIAEHLPTSRLAGAAAALGHAHVELDADGLARGLYLYHGLGRSLWPSLALAAAQLQGQGPGPEPGDAGNAAPYVNVRAQFVAVPLAGGAGTFPTYSYADVLSQPPQPGLFQGKTVFVGATASGFGDILPTPFSSLARPMPGVEYHANSYSALTQAAMIHPVTELAPNLLCLLVLVGVALTLPRLRPAQTVAFTIALTAMLVGLFALFLLGPRLWLPVANSLLVPILAFPVWSARRLAMTNRFLNRQLDELGHSPQLSLSEPATRHPATLLDQLKALLAPDGWYLAHAESAETLSAHNLDASQRPPLTAPGQWVHTNNQSWVRLVRGDQAFDLGLKLPENLGRGASQRYLRRLTLDPNYTPKPIAGPKENISARIERVRQATERMNTMQQFIRESFERMPDGVIVTDELGVIVFANGHIEEWFHEPRPSLDGLPLARLLQGHDPRDNPPWQETVSETLTQRQSRTVDLRVHGRDFLIHFAPFEIDDTAQNGIIANISDISELREQQRQHREAIDFISHDVRSPLVSQLALIEQLKRNPSEIQPEQLDQLGRLARRSYQLAEEFVQLARAEQLSETRFYECEFLAIVENARDSVSEQALDKGIRLALQGSEDLWLNGNPELLERAVINLLTNAVQYSPANSVVTIQVFEAGHQACLTVSDEGCGIAPDELPHLFDRYRRQKSSELSGNRGAGLGLSFVHVVVEKHRGQIEVQSSVGHGSTFTIRLPVANPLPHGP